MELSSHLSSLDGVMLQFDNPSVVFREPLRPGAARVVYVPLRAPRAPGLYRVEIDMLWGDTTWVSSLGHPACAMMLEVGTAVRAENWWLEAHGGNGAALSSVPDQPDGFRIDFTKVLTPTAWHIEVNQGGFVLAAGTRYTFVFLARADGPRTVAVAVSRAHAPWDGLGLYQPIEVGSAWAEFRFDFEATDDDHDARIHFDVGGSGIPVEVARTRLSPDDRR